MDISSIISSTRLYNLHSHSQYCDGRASIADMTESAAALGYLHYGVTPHSPLPIESPCNMSRGDVDAYMADVDEARRRLEGRMHVYTGMEIDYLGPEWGPSHPYFASIGLDYSIGSVHFIPTQDGHYVDIDGKFENFRRKMRECFHNDIEYVVETFYRRSCDMVDAGGFDILGHFDKIGHNGGDYCPGLEDMPFYRKAVDRLIDKIIAKGVTIEINTKAWPTAGRFFPAERYWKRLAEAGVPMVVNSDAHYPDRIDTARNEAFARLDNLLTR